MISEKCLQISALRKQAPSLEEMRKTSSEFFPDFSVNFLGKFSNFAVKNYSSENGIEISVNFPDKILIFGEKIIIRLIEALEILENSKNELQLQLEESDGKFEEISQELSCALLKIEEKSDEITRQFQENSRLKEENCSISDSKEILSRKFQEITEENSKLKLKLVHEESKSSQLVRPSCPIFDPCHIFDPLSYL